LGRGRGCNRGRRIDRGRRGRGPRWSTFAGERRDHLGRRSCCRSWARPSPFLPRFDPFTDQRRVQSHSAGTKPDHWRAVGRFDDPVSALHGGIEEQGEVVDIPQGLDVVSGGPCMPFHPCHARCRSNARQPRNDKLHTQSDKLHRTRSLPSCRWSGCTEGTDGGRKPVSRPGNLYCSHAHYIADQAGKPRPWARRGEPQVRCDRCGEVLPGWRGMPPGYRPASWIKMARHHYCPACLPLWQAGKPKRWRAIYGRCGHRVSKPGVELCGPCFRRCGSPRTRRASVEEDLIAATIEQLGGDYRKVDVARVAGVSRRTVYNVFERWARPRPPTRKPGGCSNPSYAGYVRHVQRGETPCGPCREARLVYRRESARRKREGEPGPGKGRPRGQIRHGTLTAVNRHQRDGEPMCPECRSRWKTYMREYRRKLRAERGV